MPPGLLHLLSQVPRGLFWDVSKKLMHGQEETPELGRGLASKIWPLVDTAYRKAACVRRNIQGSSHEVADC